MADACLAVYRFSINKRGDKDDKLILGAQNGLMFDLHKAFELIENNQSKQKVARLDATSVTHLSDIHYQPTKAGNIYLSLRLNHGTYGYSANIYDTKKNKTVHTQTTTQAAQRPHDVLIAAEKDTDHGFIVICLPTGRPACYSFIRDTIVDLLDQNSSYDNLVYKGGQVSMSSVVTALLKTFHTKRITAVFDAPASIDAQIKQRRKAQTNGNGKAKKSAPLRMRLSVEAARNSKLSKSLAEFEAQKDELATLLEVPDNAELSVTGTCADGKERTFALGDDNPIRTYMQLPPECIGTDGNPIRDKVLEESKTLVASLV